MSKVILLTHLKKMKSSFSSVLFVKIPKSILHPQILCVKSVSKHLGCEVLVSHRLTVEQVEQAEMAGDYLTVWHAGT